MKHFLLRVIAVAAFSVGLLRAQEPTSQHTMMAADADPSFEVATIKPHDPEVTGQGINIRGRNFSTHNISLADLIRFAYRVNGRQVIGGPEWFDKDRYDISAVPDGEGTPTGNQWRRMLQKLIEERFKMKFHHDKRELSVYVLSVGKDGPRNLVKSVGTGILPNFGFTPVPGGVSSFATNTTMGEYAQMVQEGMFDRPVLDQTGISGRYDLKFTFMPDDSLFGGRGPAPGASDNPAPSFFTAIQEQLGLKLDAVKAPTDVMVIDHVEKPSEN